jgi:hypothetical protein
MLGSTGCLLSLSSPLHDLVTKRIKRSGRGHRARHPGPEDLQSFLPRYTSAPAQVAAVQVDNRALRVAETRRLEHSD